MSRATGTVGMCFLEAVAQGKFLTYGMDREVERAYRNIERDYPRLRCAWDMENKEHMIVEHCADGVHRLVLNSKTFFEDSIRARIQRADSSRFDPMEEIERAEKEAEKAEADRLHEAVGAAGEKLAHAFAQDGLTVRPRMSPLSVKLKKAQTLRNFEAPTRSISSR